MGQLDPRSSRKHVNPSFVMGDKLRAGMPAL